MQQKAQGCDNDPFDMTLAAQEYRLVCTGHSLGADVAELATSLIQSPVSAELHSDVFQQL